jgi:hypothetical protein
MDAGTQSELNERAFTWDTEYEIGLDQNTGTWSAIHRASADQLTGRSGDELRHAIRLDHQQRRLSEHQALAALQERSST